MSWWNPKSWFTAALRGRAAKAANKTTARRRRDAWQKFHRRQDHELNLAMAALGDYAGAASPSLGELRAGPGRLTASNARTLGASYDAASSTDGNIRHWTPADGLGAMSANSSAVRNILRRRARYEVSNNCYARGMLLTLAHDVVGTGPRIQFDTANAGGNSAADSFLEARFAAWARAAKLAAKMRLARVAEAQDGETFYLLASNSGLRDEIKLDVRVIECDQIATPDLAMEDATHVDGIVFDALGNPVEYHLLGGHPGEASQSAKAQSYSRIPAANMVHRFRADRPGQVRGIPQITPALPLFAQLRRFTLATLDAAEAAADFAVLLYTEMPPDAEAAPVRPMTSIDLERRMMTAIPAGWKAAQMKAEHPATTYEMFKRALVGEIGRCLLLPYGVAAADSSDYNFASGRLDLLPYRKMLQIEQGQFDGELLDRVVRSWLDEALLRYGEQFPGIATLNRGAIAWGFVWDGVGYGVNPVDEANARQIDLSTGVSNLPREHERLGQDWETEQQRAAQSLGVTVEHYQELLRGKMFAAGGQAASPQATQAKPDEATRKNEQADNARV